MIVKRKGDYIEEINKVYMDDVELLVAGANIAGYLEADAKIVLEDDRELATFLISLLEQWYRNDDTTDSFVEHVEKVLLERFGA